MMLESTQTNAGLRKSARHRQTKILCWAVLASLLVSASTASRVLTQDGEVVEGEPIDMMPPGRAEELVEDGPPGGMLEEDAAATEPKMEEDLRSLPPFEYVTSCVPLNILVLANQEGANPANEPVNGEDAGPVNGEAEDPGPYSVWIEAESAVIKGLKTEVINSTLHVDFADADFRSSTPIKVIVSAPEDSLKGVHNSGVVSTMVVLGFSPTEDFDITNTSPFGALVVDDLKADSADYRVNIASFGNGFTAVLGDLENLAVKSTGGTGDIFIDGAETKLNVELQGTGNIIVGGSEHLIITGDVAGPSSGLVAFTRGSCSVTTSFEEDMGMSEMMEEDMPGGESMMGRGPGGRSMAPPDMMVHGCVQIPEAVGEDDAATAAFGVPDVADYMTWTCGLMVKGSFNCLRGVNQWDWATESPDLDCAGDAMRRPECRTTPRGTRVQGRAAHGIPGSRCSVDIDAAELLMSSVVQGMDVFPEDAASQDGAETLEGNANSDNGRESPSGSAASVQGAFGVVEGMEN